MSNEWREVPLRIADRIGDWAIYAGSRFLILSPLVVADFVEWTANGVAKLARKFHVSYYKLVVVYDSLPYGAIQTKTIEASASTVSEIRPIPLLQILNDPTEEKELILLGTKGSGKSTTAQWLAYTLGGKIKVYEPEGTPYDWRGLEVLGKGENWAEIEQGMQADLEHLSAQLLIRRNQGDEALTGTDSVIIGEEYPEIASKVGCSEEWLERHARRGRKARVRLILISQFDQAAAWNMEGKLQLLACFYRLRLSKMAKEYARKLKRTDLVEWLEQSRQHALLDDIPVLLPPYEEMKRVIQQGSSSSLPPGTQIQNGSTLVLSPSPDQNQKTEAETPEPTENQGFQPPETSFGETSEGGEIGLLERILGAFGEGRSDDWIAKNVIMKSQSIGYQKARGKVEQIRKRWGNVA